MEYSIFTTSMQDERKSPSSFQKIFEQNHHEMLTSPINIFMDIDRLKAIVGFSKGFAKPNRFKIEFAPIPTMRSYTDETLTFLCESTSLPGKQITTFEAPLKLARNEVKTPNGYLNGDISFTFLLTNDYLVKNVFEDWMEAIIPKKDYLLNYPEAYERDITIFQLDEHDRIAYNATLIGAYPITVNDIELNNEASNGIGKMRVTFTYLDYA